MLDTKSLARFVSHAGIAGLFAGLLAIAFSGFFAGTYFTQDGFVWLTVAKLHDEPLTVLWRDTQCGQFYRPVGRLWWYAVHTFAGRHVLPYQVLFLVSHLLNAALAMLLVRQLFNPKAAAAVFLFVALDPLFADPISSHYCFIFDTLGMNFYLLSLLLLMRAVQNDSKRLTGLSLLAALAAYFSKEAFFTLPAVAALSLGIQNDQTWKLQLLTSRVRYVALHILVLGVAIIWRSFLLKGLGGYGLVHLSSATDAMDHLKDRLGTLLNFAAWSVVPHIPWWSGEIINLIPTIVLVAVLTLFCYRNSPLAAFWSWYWIVITWAPSAVMVTHAPVSWYPASLGTAVLLANCIATQRYRLLLCIGLGLYLSLYAQSYYTRVEPTAVELKNQCAALRRHFPDAAATAEPGSRFILLEASPDLLPDAVVKYVASYGTPLNDVLFFNATTPRNWVFTNSDKPARFEPMYIDPQQGGYMELGSYRVYPLTDAGRRDDVVRSNFFQFLKWDGDQWIEVQAELTK